MRDQDDAEAVRLSQFPQEMQDSSLDGHIKAGGGLVGDQDPGATRQRDGDGDPLTHASAELVGISVERSDGIGDPHLMQEVGGAFTSLPLADVQVVPEMIGELRPHGEHGVEGRTGILHDERDVLAANAVQLLPRQAEEIAPSKPSHTAGLHSLRQESQHGHHGYGLAASALPRHSRDTTREDIQVEPVDHTKWALAASHHNLQVLDPQDRGELYC